ncbi:disulfide bond formation protein B, partial [Craterilacuibacter sp.]|uniref:disulfide bond formation protein B n=1 Tax=Craterilacuibacter sp. TaxID=2870909 RepID=UPI003F3198C4
MKLQLPGRRAGFLLLALACAGAMGFALFAQYVLGLEPCPMCIMQRIAVIVTGVMALLAAALPRVQARVTGSLALLASLVGGGVAAR